MPSNSSAPGLSADEQRLIETYRNLGGDQAEALIQSSELLAEQRVPVLRVAAEG